MHKLFSSAGFVLCHNDLAELISKQLPPSSLKYPVFIVNKFDVDKLYYTRI